MAEDESQHLVAATEEDPSYAPETKGAVELQSPLASPSKDVQTDFPKVEEKHEEKHEEKKKAEETKFDAERGTTAKGYEPGILPPDIFTGVKRCETKLVYIDNPSSATLQTKLATLGVQDFRLLAAIRARSLGRAVVGWDTFLLPRKFWKRLFDSQRKEKLMEGAGESELVLLPGLFSRGFSYINVYVRIMLAIILVISVLGFAIANSSYGVSSKELNKCIAQVESGNITLPDEWGWEGDENSLKDLAEEYCQEAAQPESSLGQAWAVGTLLSLGTLFIMSTYTTSPVGTLPFLRAMGKPEVEEYMFSYSWSKNPSEIRTLAKAMWQNDVGCWIDVVKLNSGDAIRPVVRTMMKRVYRCVIFLSKPYLGSPNCCVEIQEAIKYPDKITFCLLEPIPEVMPYLAFLSKDHAGLKICHSIGDLIQILEREISSPDDKAYAWWKSQQITISGAPERLVARRPIPMFSIVPKFRPLNSLYVGPLYISGDCTDSGTAFSPPWLLITALFAVGFNFIDMFVVFHSKKKREVYVYVLLAAICLTILAPFFEFKKLVDTRFWMHPIMKPLLASASLKTPIKVIVKGNSKDPICQNLRNYLKRMGHGVADEHAEYEQSEEGSLRLVENHITVLVMDTIPSRDKYLNGDDAHLGKIMQNSVVVYSGSDNPFGDGTEIASKLMRYLVLTKNDCKDTLAENILSGIAIRAVKYLHHGHEMLV